MRYVCHELFPKAIVGDINGKITIFHEPVNNVAIHKSSGNNAQDKSFYMLQAKARNGVGRLVHVGRKKS